MKCTNLLIGLMIVYICLSLTESMKQAIPSDLSKFTQNVDGYQNAMRYFQVLNNMNNINGMNNNMNNLNSITPMSNLNNLNNMSSSINPLAGLNQQQLVSKKVFY